MYLLRGLVALFALLQLFGCSAVSSLSEETFTFQGKLPKGFGMEAQAQYTRLDPNCAVSRRDLYREFTTESLFSDAATEYRFEIPVFYRVSGCRVRLDNVGLYTYGKYGVADWQYSRDLGGLYVVYQLPEGSPGFDNYGSLYKSAQCEWLFQLSTARSRLGNISKLLSCKNDGAYLLVNELVGKVVEIDFSVSEIERPGWDKRWIKTNAGWKPCQGTAQSERCQAEPTFKVFKMNGRECTVYPNCTE